MADIDIPECQIVTCSKEGEYVGIYAAGEALVLCGDHVEDDKRNDLIEWKTKIR